MKFDKNKREEVIPNTVEEDLKDGVDNFLLLPHNRTHSMANPKISPRYSPDGEVLDRSILGSK